MVLESQLLLDVQVRGEVHHDRRLHQLMLQEDLKAWDRLQARSEPEPASDSEDDGPSSIDSRPTASPADSATSLHEFVSNQTDNSVSFYRWGKARGRQSSKVRVSVCLAIDPLGHAGFRCARHEQQYAVPSFFGSTAPHNILQKWQSARHSLPESYSASATWHGGLHSPVAISCPSSRISFPQMTAILMNEQNAV